VPQKEAARIVSQIPSRRPGAGIILRGESGLPTQPGFQLFLYPPRVGGSDSAGHWAGHWLDTSATPLSGAKGTNRP
jgi:hypothetical protein